METSRARLLEVLDTLSDDQVETVLSFAMALSQGRAVVSACAVPEDDMGAGQGEPSAIRGAIDSR